MSCLDAGSHLYIPKTVIANGKTLDFENLGTVWLPGFHLLVMPWVAIRSLYTTGLAGTVINSLFLAGSGVLVYRFLGGWAGFSAALIFVINPYSLIYATSPMTELSGLFFLLLGVYLFSKYWKNDYHRYWIYSGLALGFGTLIRYEVWIVAGVASVLFFLRSARQKRYRDLPLGFLPFYGIITWFLYNWGLFGSIFAFLLHPGAREPLNAYYFGSVYRSAKHFFWILNHLSGWLIVPALAGGVWLARHDRRLCITTGLIALAGLIHIPLGALGHSLGFVRFELYLLPALILTSLAPISSLRRGYRLGWISAISLSFLPVIPSFFELVRAGENSHIAGTSHQDVDYPGVAQLLGESRQIMAKVDSFPLLMSTHQGRQFLSIASGEAPIHFFDGYDSPQYFALSERPWEHFPSVLVDSLTASDRLWQEYFGGRNFNYRYFAELKFRKEFLAHYQLIFEDNWGLLFQRNL